MKKQDRKVFFLPDGHSLVTMTAGPTKDLIQYLKTLTNALQIPALNGVTAGFASISVDESDEVVASKLVQIMGGPARDFASAFSKSRPTRAVQTGVLTTAN